MLAEKFIILIEALIKDRNHVPAYADGAPRVISSAAHVPVILPERSSPAHTQTSA